MAGGQGINRNRVELRLSIICCLVLLLTCDLVSKAQESRTVQPTTDVGSLSSSPLSRQQGPSGAAKISAAPAQLSLADAIRIAIDNNPATHLAQEQRRAANGFVQQARSALLPNISATAYQA